MESAREALASDDEINEALRRETTFVNLLQVASIVADEHTSLEVALQVVLDRVCEHAGWAVGHAYFVSPDGTELINSNAWHLDDPDRYKSFQEASASTPLRAGDGLPGRVLATGRPVWVVDATKEASFPRVQKTPAAAVRAGFAFPVLVGTEVVAVLEFFSPRAADPDPALLSVMAHVGTQLGRAVERQRNRDALRETEQRAQEVIETANDAFVGMDTDCLITRWNRRAETMFGWSRGEAVGRRLDDTIIPERYREAHREAIARFVATGRGTIMGKTIEIQALHRRGHEIPVELTVWPVSSGGDPSFNAFLRDITERKEAEDAIRRSRDFARLLISSSVDGVFAFDRDFRYTEWNQAMERISGVAESDALGKTAFEVFPLFKDTGEHELFEQALQGNTVTASDRLYVVPDTNGSDFYERRYSPLFDESGEVVGGLAIIHDITERKRAEEELRAANEQLTSVFDKTFNNALIGMALVGLDGRILQVNPALCEITGRSQEDLLATTTQAITHPDDLDTELEFLNRVCAGELLSYQFEKRFQHADGHEVWTLLVASVVTKASGEPLHLIHQIADITERKRAEDRLTHQALHDALTGLPNRTLFLDRLRHAIARTSRWGAGLVAVMFIDFDRFKVINDSLGHDAGDAVLVAISERLQGALRPSDTVARFGGDEFVVLCEEVKTEQHVEEIARRIAGAVGEPLPLESGSTVLTASLGIALSTSPSDSPEVLLRDADAAMYRAKEGGRARYEVFDDSMRSRAVNRLEVENDLRAAVPRGELRLHYQPQVHLADGRIIGVEALTRWQHPTRGLLFPNDFISVAEESGLIIEVDRWALREGCRQLHEWMHDHGAMFPLALSVNASARSLAQLGYVDAVRDALSQCDVPPELIYLEITESVLMDMTGSTMKVLNSLRELGVRLAIDDFGTGYSSLSYLKRFAVDLLKVDQSFVEGIGHDADDSAIAATVINLAHNMRLSALAEGVEAPPQVEELKSLGCDLAQGYHFGPPQPPEALGELLQRSHPRAE
jgi:diguanylate cyclase (GGDEF)-like protein/PAS domain S-box-containing protein